MKYIKLLLLFIMSQAFTWQSQTLSVLTYGATGNGTTDDTNAIQACLTAAHTAGMSVYFPPGTYLCNITNASKHVLEFNAGGVNNVTIYGKGATILHTVSDSNSLLYVYAFSKSTGVNIGGLTFKNTHGLTTAPSNALYIAGTNGQLIDTISILSDTFSGFQIGIQALGINGIAIKGNSFLSPNGHDNGQHGNSVPCVCIWLFDNSNGKCFNIDIEQNYANGYSGPLPITAPRPLDGFLYGTGYNYYVATNFLYNFSEEYIAIEPYSTLPQIGSPYTILITNNFLDCTLPAGSVENNGAAHKYNYGIRVDAPNTTVTYNRFLNYVWGFMSRPTDYSTAPIDTVFNFNVTNNTFVTPADTTTNIVQHDLYFAGNGYQSPNIRMYNNLTLKSDTSRVFTNNAASPVLTGNIYRPTNQ